jgi:serine/threonine-protein kinase HipA
MIATLDALRFVEVADVYKAGALAARLERVPGAGIRFAYLPAYLVGQAAAPVASTLPLGVGEVLSPGGSLPAFFAGLLPEGRRLSVLQDAVKTSLDDELTLLLAVGGDLPGDVQVCPRDQPPDEPAALVTEDVTALDLLALTGSVDRHGIPGVQSKLSAQMISAPLALGEGRFIVKLDPADYPHLVRNEAAHIVAARRLGIPVVDARVEQDARARDALLVRRFDRERGAEGWLRRPLEDATQVLGLPPADKYRVAAERVVAALAAQCAAPVLAARNLYLQFLFAWLTGNGDLHAKNVSVLGGADGRTSVSPVYDVPCTLVYGDDSLALPIGGRTTRLKRRHWAEFADAIGLTERAAASADRLALAAAASVSLESLPFDGSPLRRAVRELGFRRSELAG